MRRAMAKWLQDILWVCVLEWHRNMMDHAKSDQHETMHQSLRAQQTVLELKATEERKAQVGARQRSAMLIVRSARRRWEQNMMLGALHDWISKAFMSLQHNHRSYVDTMKHSQQRLRELSQDLVDAELKHHLRIFDHALKHFRAIELLKCVMSWKHATLGTYLLTQLIHNHWLFIYMYMWFVCVVVNAWRVGFCGF